jgi:hypothetical protein
VRLSQFSVGKWYAEQCVRQLQDPYQWETAHKWLMIDLKRDHRIGSTLERRATHLLELGSPYNEESSSDMLHDRFHVSSSVVLRDTFRILDRARCISIEIAQRHLENPDFNLIEWYGAWLLEIDLQEFRAILGCTEYQCQVTRNGLNDKPSTGSGAPSRGLALAGIQVDCHRYPHLQRNAVSVKGDARILPKPIVVQVRINGHPA